MTHLNTSPGGIRLAPPIHALILQHLLWFIRWSDIRLDSSERPAAYLVLWLVTVSEML